MANNLTLKERILTFLDLMGIKKATFFEATGIQSSNFKGANVKSIPGGDMLVKVLTTYPQLSAEWLMRGEGDMLVNDSMAVDEQPIKDIQPQNLPHLPSEALNNLVDTIRNQAEEIGRLKERIALLEATKNVPIAPVLSSTI